MNIEINPAEKLESSIRITSFQRHKQTAETAAIFFKEPALFGYFPLINYTLLVSVKKQVQVKPGFTNYHPLGSVNFNLNFLKKILKKS